jgi:hypothetical protein
MAFFKNLELSFGLTKFFENKIFLSDMGKAIKKLVKELHSIQFICYRHLIESFGSNTLLSLVVKRMLFTSSEQNFEMILPQALSDLTYLQHENEITHAQFTKLIEYIPIYFDNGKFDRDFARSLTFEQSLWNRSEFNVSSCSNHIERLHRTLKAKTAKIMTIQMKVAAVVTELWSKFNTPLKNPSIQAMKHYFKMKKHAISLKVPDYDNCPYEYCNWSFIYSRRFGIENFPCTHTVQKIEVLPHPHQNFQHPPYKTL